jgi:hypothetical protein
MQSRWREPLTKYVFATATGALALLSLAILAPAEAGPITGFDALKRSAADQNPVEQVHGWHANCEWSRFRGWHVHGRFGSTRSCNPGRGWRYERRCWFGPGGVRYCRFTG